LKNCPSKEALHSLSADKSEGLGSGWSWGKGWG